MDDTVVVIMLRDANTGYLEKEIGCYRISEFESLIYMLFAIEKEGLYTVVLRLTCDRDVADWEYDAILDYYDCETIAPHVTSIKEYEGNMNPTWEITVPFIDQIEGMEERISGLLMLHKKELYSVYEAIVDKKDEYINEEIEEY